MRGDGGYTNAQDWTLWSLIMGAVMDQEPLPADDLATEGHDAGTDTHPAKGPAGQALEVVDRKSVV